ncbi:hypothetical protein BD626DRAFT_534538 [Schizophyllum amplum]|uniref:RlpA-like double-psi beta-barrel-protein domain-containing protein-containing protein n=1 Tax=Schizophyllum amplum TaxID=97359 RepID=A0A550CUQ8_9AGAR|nr:hypothetical protein BD626DRAFT_534538 [Auriculariopsis ampla]
MQLNKLYLSLIVLAAAKATVIGPDTVTVTCGCDSTPIGGAAYPTMLKDGGEELCCKAVSIEHAGNTVQTVFTGECTSCQGLDIALDIETYSTLTDDEQPVAVVWTLL